MLHYVCTGECGGVAEVPGTCQAKDCSQSAHPLEECNCDDGYHSEVLDVPEEDNDDE